MIGFWNYTVILTFMSLASTIMGIIMASENRFTHAMVFLALSGLFDAFDGKVARSKKDRTEDEKLYGIQLDSLCDVICFGVFPVILCRKMGIKGIVGAVSMIFYSIAAVTRLAYFNVLETNRQNVEENVNKFYHGLPVTSIAVIFPLIYLINFWMTRDCKGLVLEIMLLVTGALFIIDFKVKKPNDRQIAFLIFFVMIVLVVCIYFYHRKRFWVWRGIKNEVCRQNWFGSC